MVSGWPVDLAPPDCQQGRLLRRQRNLPAKKECWEGWFGILLSMLSRAIVAEHMFVRRKNRPRKMLFKFWAQAE